MICISSTGVRTMPEHLGFPLETGQPVRACREGVGEDLQRDVTAKLRVGGAIDLTHAALIGEGGMGEV